MNEKYIRFIADKLTRSGFTDIQYVTDDEQGADILATSKSGAHVCVRCIYTDKPVTANTVNEVYQAKKQYGCNAAMILTNSTFSDKAKEYAEKARVMLKPEMKMNQQPAPVKSTSAPVKTMPAAGTSNTKSCLYCRSSIDKKAKICPVCGKKQKKPIYKRWWFIVLAVWIVIMIIGSVMDSPEESAEGEREQQTVQAEPQENNVQEPATVTETLDVSEYAALTINDLHNYSQYMQGEKVVTVADITDKSGSSLKTKFPENDTFYFDFVFEFSEKSKIKEIEEGSTVAIAGTVNDVSSKGTVTLSDCAIIGIGQLPDTVETKNTMDNSASVGEAYKQLAEEKAAAEQAAQAAQEAQNKADYIASCETLVYSDVSRNPEQYKGRLTKVSGTVLQVQEFTLLGTTSVTMRVDAGNDNIWYVTYSRPEGESRILEDDWITCYGECEGVESYTTVLGSQVTIPSMKMKYYD